MGIDLCFEARVIWGSEIHITESNCGILFKRLFLHIYEEDEEESSKFIRDVTEGTLVDDIDSRIHASNLPIKLSSLSFIELLKTGKLEETIRAEIENDKDALAAWDNCVAEIQNSSIGLEVESDDEKSDNEQQVVESNDEESDNEQEMVGNNLKRRKLDNDGLLEEMGFDWHEECNIEYKGINGIESLLNSVLSEIYLEAGIKDTKCTANKVNMVSEEEEVEEGDTEEEVEVEAEERYYFRRPKFHTENRLRSSAAEMEFDIFKTWAFDNCGLPDGVKEYRFYISLKNRNNSFSGSFRGEWDIVNKKQALTEKPVSLKTMFILQRFIKVLNCLGIHVDKPRWFFLNSSTVG